MIAAAVALAVAAAVVFGIAAVNQHRAVRVALTPHRQLLSPRQVGTLVTDASWRRGFVLMALGTGLHVAALSLAPISLTQPINVVAVPTAIAATAILSRRLPRRSVLLAAAGVMVGVAALVTSGFGTGDGNVPSAAVLGAAAVAIFAVTVLLHLAARLLLRRSATTPTWVAPVLLGIAGAANFGTASSIFRLLTQDLTGTEPLADPALIVMVCAIPAALTVGAWSIHQAYAVGAASAVTAASALADPIVAATLGMVVLGETHPFTVARFLVLVTAAAIAAAGVIHLSRADRDHTDPTQSAHHDLGSACPTTTRTLHAHPARR